jgi:butyrate kinase
VLLSELIVIIAAVCGGTEATHARSAIIEVNNVEQGQGPGLERAADGKHVPCP